jgi:hypothetical protein
LVGFLILILLFVEMVEKKKGKNAGERKKKESEPLTQHSWKERLGITAC